MEQLDREIERLEGRLDRASDARAIGELANVRRGLTSSGPRGPGIELADLRLGFACKQRWDDMVGDDRVRVCAGCDRPVFNLSGMTRAEAEAVLATRGLTPCVRFYRRPDGTIMTTDCPTGARPAPRRLAVVASSLAAAGSAIAAGTAMADPPAATGSADPQDDLAAMGSGSDAPEHEGITIDKPYHFTGIPLPARTFEGTLEEVGVIIEPERRPTVEWSLWGRLGAGVASQTSEVAARRVTAVPADATASTWEAAAAADLTFRVARGGDLRLGAWGEVRTSSGPVAGAELVLEGLPPHPYTSRIGGAGSLVLRAGANDRIVTGALGFGYVGSFPSYDPWISWARHVVGARVVVSVDRALDAPHDWSATLGLEIDPIGAVHALYDLVTGR
jgi:hypothetical protein